MSRRRVWEEDLGQDTPRHIWEQEPPDLSQASASAGPSDTESAATVSHPFKVRRAASRVWAGPAAERDTREEEEEEAGVQLARLLVQLNAEGQLSAKHTCTIAHWAANAGCKGPVCDLAFRPDAPTGHFQRHLDSACGFRDQDYYKLPVPAYSKRLQQRDTLLVSVLPPHECLHAEFCKDPDLLQKARARDWPTAFHKHPVMTKASGQAVPLALYLDGAQYSKVGATVLVFVLVNMVSGTKHLISTLNKRILCRCGCRGWCTLHPVLQFIAWSLDALATGTFPTSQHEGAPWPGGQESRSSLGGMPLACGIAAVQQVRGDWAEFSHSLGLPTWRSSNFPCLWCAADRDNLYNFTHEEDEADQWATTDHASYAEACEKCEIWVTISSPSVQQEIADKLFYDKRTYGSRGRCLKQAIPILGLLSGDRLEPSAQVPNVGLFEDLDLPRTVCFWRVSEETLTKHRNPLFGSISGLSLQSLKVDTLHCLALGVWQSACSAILQAMVDEDLYCAKEAGATTVESRAQHTVTHVQAELTAFQSQLRRAGRSCTAVSTDLGLPPNFRLKGGETKTFLLYLIDSLRHGRGQKLKQQEDMLQALLALKANDTATEGPLKWPPAAQQDANNQI